MPRKAIKSKSWIESWDDVNEALRLIDQKRNAVEAEIAKYNEDEAKRRKKLDEFTTPLRNEIIALETEMQYYCTANRADLEGKKSKELPNGRIDFRLGKHTVKTLKGFTWSAVFELIKRTLKEYIRVKEEVNKDQIIIDYISGVVTAEKLNDVGCAVIQEETFGYTLKSELTNGSQE